MDCLNKANFVMESDSSLSLATVRVVLQNHLNKLLERFQEEEREVTAWAIVGEIYSLVMFANAANIITYAELEEFYNPIRAAYVDKVYFK